MSERAAEISAALFYSFVDQRHGKPRFPAVRQKPSWWSSFDRYLGGYAHVAASVRHRSMCGFTGRCRQSVQSIADAVSFCGKQLDCAPQQNFAIDSLEIVRCVGKMQADSRRAPLRPARSRTSAWITNVTRPNGRCKFKPCSIFIPPSRSNPGAATTSYP